ncbi:H+/gluconate symporter-like permease [Methanohalophilus levihalophilus]|uniref:hypothetical protein n=1 Tax=Methanohalophilus levihalophilus TaxID=1431282 RepID=UPI001AE25D14|nr:hypothetical protein [Methanohalophilus levihalophilus]MBP2029367.1 H+/gluconate symporter-like permease [Methanohalophilus levihalophilus]
MSKANELIEKLREKEDAQVGVVGAIISIGMMLIVAVILFAQFMLQADTQMSTVNNTAAMSAYSNVLSSVWGSLNLASMYPWILAAVALMGAVLLIGARNRG